ncbi:MAG: hypothetical protein MI864_12330 [Pseudomonadales bacterium]|nr:hypothetical protein [Pseudomonadales bacterium]
MNTSLFSVMLPLKMVFGFSLPQHYNTKLAERNQENTYKDYCDVYSNKQKRAGFEISLSGFKECQYVDIKLDIKYSLKSYLFTKGMSLLSYGPSFVLEFPCDFEPHFDVMGIDREHYNKHKSDVTINVKCNTWVLPDCGIAVVLKNKLPTNNCSVAQSENDKKCRTPTQHDRGTL